MLSSQTSTRRRRGAAQALLLGAALLSAALLGAPLAAQPLPDAPPGSPPEEGPPPSSDDPAEAAGRVEGLTPPSSAPGISGIPRPNPDPGDRPMQPSGDPPAPNADPAADPAAGGADPTDAPRGASAPGVVGPPLGPLLQPVLTSEPNGLLLVDPTGDLFLCDLTLGRCKAQGSTDAASRPICASHLRNGWSWAMGANGQGFSLCGASCGQDFRPGAAPPLPPNELSQLPDGATEGCGNAPTGASFWIGRHTLQRWGDRPDAEIIPLPGTTGATLNAYLASPGRLWLVRDDQLWARPWDPRDGTAFKVIADVGPEAPLWPPACAAATRRIDQLLYIPPLPRGATSGLRAGLWSIGPCGLVPLHRFDLAEGAADAILWPEDIYLRPDWPPAVPISATLHPLHTVWIAAPVDGSPRPQRRLWSATPGTLTLRLLPQPPLSGLTGVAQLDAVSYALGDGVLELPEHRRVGLQHDDGQPFGVERLHDRMADERGAYHAVLTDHPPALWLWKPRQPWPEHVPLARDLNPADLRAIAFTQTAANTPALAYQLPDGAWWEQPLDLTEAPRLRTQPPVKPPAPTAPPANPINRRNRTSPTENDSLAVNGTALGVAALLALVILGAVIWWRRR